MTLDLLAMTLSLLSLSVNFAEIRQKKKKKKCQYLLKQQVKVTAEYFSGSLNVKADSQSRNSRDPSELKVCPKVFKQIWQERGMSPKNCLHEGYLINHPVLCLETQPFQLDDRWSTKDLVQQILLCIFPIFLRKVSYNQTEKNDAF